jgi:hypothetical protein
MFVALDHHLDSGPNQECGKDIQNPTEAIY